jgi:hypothetical protein
MCTFLKSSQSMQETESHFGPVFLKDIVTKAGNNVTSLRNIAIK